MSPDQHRRDTGASVPGRRNGREPVDNPTWYVINATAARARTWSPPTPARSRDVPANSCYTLTDRGTFDFLASKNSPSAGTTGIPHLAIVARDNSASAPGGANALINYFHAYIINPSKPGETVNLDGRSGLRGLHHLAGHPVRAQGLSDRHARRQRNAGVRRRPRRRRSAPGLPDHDHGGQDRDGHREHHQPPAGIPGAVRPDRERSTSSTGSPACRSAAEDRRQRATTASRSCRRPSGSYQAATGAHLADRERLADPGLRRHPVAGTTTAAPR